MSDMRTHTPDTVPSLISSRSGTTTDGGFSPPTTPGTPASAVGPGRLRPLGARKQMAPTEPAALAEWLAERGVDARAWPDGAVAALAAEIQKDGVRIKDATPPVRVQSTVRVVVPGQEAGCELVAVQQAENSLFVELLSPEEPLHYGEAVETAGRRALARLLGPIYGAQERIRALDVVEMLEAGDSDDIPLPIDCTIHMLNASVINLSDDSWEDERSGARTRWMWASSKDRQTLHKRLAHQISMGSKKSESADEATERRDLIWSFVTACWKAG